MTFFNESHADDDMDKHNGRGTETESDLSIQSFLISLICGKKGQTKIMSSGACASFGLREPF